VVCGVCESCWKAMAENRSLRGENIARDKSQVVADSAVVWGDFSGVLRDAIHALKFAGRPRLGRELGRRMAEEKKHQLAHLDALVPMPLHAARLRERGYNQSVEIAFGLADVLEVPVLEGWVERKKNTQQQASLRAEERLLNVRDAFVWKRRMDPGQQLGLVDDVVTTGATMRACIEAHGNEGRLRLQPVLLAKA
jgi:ComF family protein